MSVVGTVATRSELAHVRVLAAALRAHGAPRLVALVLDDTGPGVLRADEPFTVARLDAVGVPDPERLLVAPREAAREAAKAHLLAHLLAEGGPVVLLDPWVDVHAGLDGLLEGDVALVPRRLEPAGGDAEPGLYRSGVLAARGDAGRGFSAWWAAADPGDGDALTRLDAAPALPGAAVVRDPGHGVAAWNLAERPLARTEDGRLTAAGAPLATLVLRGADPRRPYWLGDGAGVDASVDPVLAELLEDYGRRLLAAGWEAVAELPWGYERLGDGTPLDAALRRVLEEATAAGVELGDPFTREGAERLLTHAAAPADQHAAWGLNRYLVALWTLRPDLSRAFPDLGTSDGEAFAAWAAAQAAAEGLPAELVPRAGEPGEAGLGVNVAGYLSSTLGISEAARLYMTALRTAGVPVRMESLDPPRPATSRAATASTPPPRTAPRELDAGVDHGLNLVCVNAPQLPDFARRIGADFFEGRPTVGVWAWETSVIPASWAPAFDWVDEIWTHSTYSASLIAPRSPVPVVAVPPPVLAPEPAGAALDLDVPDGFWFLFAFDFLSTIERKNPIGVIEAFTRAFAPGEGPQLVLKAINGDYKPEQLARVRWAARGRDDVHVVDRWLPDEQRRGLTERADCYVSLHRSEGFGLTMAEAMAMGKPVIATGYSGNLDFMDASTAYLVEHRLETVGPGVDIYPADGVWADPDLDHAAALMRRVVEQPEEAAARGARAAEDVLRRFSPAAVGALARTRLEQLAARSAERADPGGRASDAVLRSAASKAAYDPLAAAGTKAPKDLARRAALQAMRPYTFHQRELNALLVEVLEGLHAEVAELERIVADQRRTTRRAEWRLRGLEARLAARGDVPRS